MATETLSNNTIDDMRQDPTSMLPEEPMVYELKKQKKKKKKKQTQEDPLKDIHEKVPLENIRPVEIIPPFLDPEVSIKVENIEVDLDFNDFTTDGDLLIEDAHSEEPSVKLGQDNRNAVILTLENIIDESVPFGYSRGTGINNHVCGICHLVFQSTKTLRMHQKRKHKVFRKSFTHICDHCGMSYEQRNSLVAHIKRKHDPQTPSDDGEERTCEICALVFKGVTRLRMHMRRKHGSFEESFNHVCDECGLTYDKYRSLMVHMQRKHTNQTKTEVNQWYKCPFCPKIFTKRETYARHVQRKHRVNEDGQIAQNEEKELGGFKNPKTGEISCKECPLVFSSVNYLKLHMRRKHNALKEDFRLKCRICNLSYDKIESLKRHVRRKHDKGSHCTVCNKQFDTRESYLNHSHMKIIKECSICGLIFASQGGLAKHLRCTHKMDAPKTVFCNICNEGFSDRKHLKPHFMKVHLKVSYTCIYCSKVFKAKESYRRHVMFKHPKVKETVVEFQKCEQCTETFPDEFELCKHINLVHGRENTANRLTDNDDVVDDIVKTEEIDTKDTFQCTKCPDNYPTWESLRLHFEQNHRNLKETQCQVCGEFIPVLDLSKHMKCHNTETVVQCKYCEFNTSNRASMTQHMLRHKNAETVNCDYPGCRYKSFYEGAMDRHKQKHKEQGVKLQCSKCPFQTMNKYILRYHEEAHLTGKKRYSCDQCDYATILPANLVQHKYKHSSEKRFKCEMCSFATKYNTSLRIHVKKKHCDLPSNS